MIVQQHDSLEFIQTLISVNSFGKKLCFKRVAILFHIKNQWRSLITAQRVVCSFYYSILFMYSFFRCPQTDVMLLSIYIHNKTKSM